MSFVAPIFFPFLLGTFILFISAKNHRRVQLAILLLASYIFYGWVSRRFVLLVLFSTCLDYYAGYFIYHSDSQRKKRFFLLISIVGNLGLLSYFKYLNFFIGNFNSAAATLGVSLSVPTLNIILPIGISFYTFQTLSYSLDIYLGKLKPAKSFIEFSYFVAAFPQLLAGPIVRAREFLPQLQKNLVACSRYSGWFYIFYGLGKKLLLADPIGSGLVDPVFAKPENFASLDLIIAVWAFGLQIFLDFSAYSDIALGLGRLFGVSLPVNFKSPLFVTDPDSFWKRWHITLTSWFRDYLFIPLATVWIRKSRHGVYAALLFTFVVVGFWHGARWTFVVFGLIHGFYLVAYQVSRRKIPKLRLPYLLKAFFFYQLLCLPWVFLRATDVGQAVAYLERIVQFHPGFSFPVLPVLLVFGLAIFVHSWVEPRLEAGISWFSKFHWFIHSCAFYVLFILIGFVTKNVTFAKAFFYFQF